MRLLFLIPMLLLLACPSTRGSFFDDPDPEPTPDPQPTPGDDARMGWIQLEHRWTEDSPATFRATASFHDPTEYDLWPTDSTGLDECEPGSIGATAWELPASDLDVGTPVIELENTKVELNFDGTHWSRQLSIDFWEEFEEFTFRVTGGPDLPAQFYEAVVGTPATLTFEEFSEGADGVTVRWTGANDDADVRVLVYSDTDPITYVYCRFNDDGEQVIPWSTFEDNLEEGDYTFEARRQRTVDFDLGEWPGTTLGLSTAIATVSVSDPDNR
jgi:hypothetical protein